MEKSLEILNKIQEKFSHQIIDRSAYRGDDTIIIKKESIFPLARFLKEELKFNLLIDITAVDYLEKKEAYLHSSSPHRQERFEVVYHFYSLENKIRLRVKVPVPEADLTVESLSSLFNCANWAEREVYDMYGIIFSNHPDLRRILLYEEFEGHPLRKDYPIDKRQPIEK